MNRKQSNSSFSTPKSLEPRERLVCRWEMAGDSNEASDLLSYDNPTNRFPVEVDAQPGIVFSINSRRFTL